MKRNLWLLLGVAALAVIPLLMPHTAPEGAEIFAGTDGQAGQVIRAINPAYIPWFAPLFEPPSGEIESLLFGLQAALGAGALGYCLGYFRGRRRAAG